MRHKLHIALALAFIAAVSQGSAWSAVTVSWTDDLGNPHSQNLAWTPINPSDPYYVFADYAWTTTLDLTMNVRTPWTFTFTGDYTGEDEQSYPYILLYQRVLNNTGYDWTDFHLRIPTGEADEFGWVQGVTTGWDITQGLTGVDYVMPVGGIPVHSGETFYDGVFIFDDYDANADLTLVKWPTPLPEPGSAVVLLSGLIGVGAYIKRRKA